MGLLDDFSSFIKTPEGMGLLSATFGGLAGAQRGQPLNSIGRAGMSGLTGYSNAQDQQSQLQQADQMKAIRQYQIEQEKRRLAALKNLSGSVSPEMAPLVDIAPEAVVKSMFPEKEKAQLITVETPQGPMQRWVVPGSANGVDVGAPDKHQGMTGGRDQIVADNKGNLFFADLYNRKTEPVTFQGNQIQGGQYSPELQGLISGSKAQGSAVGSATGEATNNLQDIKSQMPNLDNLVKDLDTLGQKATYTTVGQFKDAATRQLGMDVGEGAIARKEYISKVDNEVLPLLRQTFGAAFTQKEGESLKATLGDPDVSPKEKGAVLRSFITSKRNQIESLNRRTGQPTEQKTASMADIAATAKASGKTTAEVTAAMKAKGYVIK